MTSGDSPPTIWDEMVPPIRALIELHEVEGTPVLVAEIPEAPLEEKLCQGCPFNRP